VVTDFSGGLVATITGEPGAGSLALSSNGHTLYVALTNTDAISAVDTRTLHETARYVTGTDAVPQHLAVVGNKVWFSYGSQGHAGIGVLDPRHAKVTLTAEPDFYGAPLLATSPSAPDTLVAGETDAGPSVIEAFDVASGAPVSTAKSNPWASPNGCEFVHGLAISANGTDVLAACGYPYFATSLKLTDLTEDGTYQTGPYTNAIATARNGRIAVGVDALSSSVYIFTPGTSTATATYTLSGFGVYGLAWSENDRKLFAVTKDGTANPVLNVITQP
jgi:sugar lactone lactonase YvrE